MGLCLLTSWLNRIIWLYLGCCYKVELIEFSLLIWFITLLDSLNV